MARKSRHFVEAGPRHADHVSHGGPYRAVTKSERSRTPRRSWSTTPRSRVATRRVSSRRTRASAIAYGPLLACPSSSGVVGADATRGRGQRATSEPEAAEEVGYPADAVNVRDAGLVRLSRLVDRVELRTRASRELGLPVVSCVPVAAPELVRRLTTVSSRPYRVWARSLIAPRERLLPGLGARLGRSPTIAAYTLVALRRVPGRRPRRMLYAKTSRDRLPSAWTLVSSFP